MAEIDKEVSALLNQKHEAQTAYLNQQHRLREVYTAGALVWVLQPPSLDVNSKLGPTWKGPLQIKSRIGEHTYIVKDRRGLDLQVHLDQ